MRIAAVLHASYMLICRCETLSWRMRPWCRGKHLSCPVPLHTVIQNMFHLHGAGKEYGAFERVWRLPQNAAEELPDLQKHIRWPSS